MPTFQSSFMRSLPAEVLTEIGRVIGAWAHIEQKFDLVYLSLIVMQSKGSGRMDDPRVAMMGAAFERRVREFRAFVDASAWPSEEKTKWDRTLSQLVSLRRKRDFLAHGVMSPILPNSGSVLQDAIGLVFKSWRNKKPHEEAKVTLQDLQRTFERMDRLYWSLFDLSLERRSTYDPSQRS